MFLPNEVLVLPDGLHYRLLALQNRNTVAWLINIVDPRAQPVRRQNAWVLCNCRRFKPTANSGKVDFKVAAIRPTDAMEALAQNALKLIEPLVARPELFEPRERARLIRERAAEVGCSETTIRLHLRRYWQGGQTLSALYGNFPNCATSTRETYVSGKRNKKGGLPYVLRKEDYEAMDKAIRGFYLKDKRNTKTGAHQWMLERFYTYIDGNGERFIKDESECPSLRQFTHWLAQEYPMEVQKRSRLGNKEFGREHRQRLGSIQLDCHGAGHMYEIDATIVDLFLVSTKDVRAIVGKPTLYLIIDRSTRLIVGWYVGFENASWMAAMMAILSIAEDKEELCLRYGLKYDPSDWVAHEVQPEEFLADLGEMVKLNSRRVSPGLRATVSNVEGLRPDFKPLVECGFKVFHQAISMELPSYDPPSNAKRRRGKAYAQDATMNIDQFTGVVIDYIVKHNKRVQENYKLTFEQVAAGVRPVPRDLWEYEMETRAGALARFEADKVRLELMPREEATVTDHGLLVRRRLYYTFPIAEKRGWFSNARAGRTKVLVSLDLRKCGRVLVHDPDKKGVTYEATLTPDYQAFGDLPFADVERHFRAAEKLTASAEQEKRQSKFEFNRRTAEIVKKSQKDYREATGGKRLSRKSRRADIATDRADEVDRERNRTVQMPASSSQHQGGPTTRPGNAPGPGIAANGTVGPTPRKGLSLAERLAQRSKGNP